MKKQDKTFKDSYDLTDTRLITDLLEEMILRVPLRELEEQTDLVITDLSAQYVDVKVKLQQNFYNLGVSKKRYIIEKLIADKKINSQKYLTN